MIKKVLVFLGTVMVGWGASFGVVATPSYAADCEGGFLGFVPWYDGLLDDKCENVVTPTDSGNGEGLAAFVWKIVANVAIDLFLAVGYLAVGFVIYGGYLFIMSDGDPAKAAKAKKTLTAAVIGIVIAVLANVIIRTILVVLGAG